MNIKNIKPYRTLQKWNEKPIELDKKGGEKVTEPEQMEIEPMPEPEPMISKEVETPMEVEKPQENLDDMSILRVEEISTCDVTTLS